VQECGPGVLRPSVAGKGRRSRPVTAEGDGAGPRV